jgi:hypothetical protein
MAAARPLLRRRAAPFSRRRLFVLQALQLPRQLEPAAVDARFHGSLRQTQPVGDLLIRELLQVAQDDGGSQRAGQNLQRLTEQDAQVLVLGGRIRPAL